VEALVETDATEDTHQELGTGLREPVLLLEDFTKLLNIVNRTFSPHVITTFLENTDHVVQVNQHQNAKINASMVLHTAAINGLLTLFTQFHQASKRSKLKS